MYNMDEVGFILGLGQKEDIVSMDVAKVRYIPSNTNRKSIPIIKSCGTNGQLINPFIICAGKQIVENWYNIEKPWGATVTTTESGYTNSVVALHWLEHFNR